MTRTASNRTVSLVATMLERKKSAKAAPGIFLLSIQRCKLAEIRHAQGLSQQAAVGHELVERRGIGGPPLGGGGFRITAFPPTP